MNYFPAKHGRIIWTNLFAIYYVTALPVCNCTFLYNNHSVNFLDFFYFVIRQLLNNGIITTQWLIGLKMLNGNNSAISIDLMGGQKSTYLTFYAPNSHHLLCKRASYISDKWFSQNVFDELTHHVSTWNPSYPHHPVHFRSPSTTDLHFYNFSQCYSTIVPDDMTTKFLRAQT